MTEDKKTLFIDGKEVEFSDEKNLLEVIRKAGMNVPTFCYRPDLTAFGACRMCVVEIEGRGIQTSCTMPPEAGLKIHLNTEKVRRIRKTVLELLLANHDRECTTCEKSGHCELQKYSEEYGIRDIKYPTIKKEDFLPLDTSNPSIVRDPNKCILCGACVRACAEFHGDNHAILGFANRGSKTRVQPMAGRDFSKTDCILCGQCQAVCPTGALTVVSDVDNVWKEINNPEKKVVAQIAPSIRVALGELFGLEPGENSIGRITAALRRIGFDLVFDTNFAADLTIMEEGTEFIERLKSGKNLPIFTSCCPAWIKYVEQSRPEYIKNLSSCKSPQSMMSPVLKELLPKYFEGYTKENTVIVSIMPCTAKKFENKRQELSQNGIPDTNFVLTTKELGRMINEAGIDFKNLEPEKEDSPFGDYTGAATIFGASGGVAEAAARTAYELVTGKELTDVNLKPMRGVNASERSKEMELDLNGLKVKVRIVSTIAEAEKALKELDNGTADFQMLEVMACPGGCVNGGGQPYSFNDTTIKAKRAAGLYKEDAELKFRKSHQNPDIKKLYAEFLENPGSHKAHEMLHTHYEDKFKGSYRDLK
ncbi:MAG TPA: [FeFe] hydrogenase, group A [Candidatus Gastranaerophilaceae bacterium]|nr:[FeFe] hydrogenase, group A [Candidatus Gastranaerophilaceae bacterium]